VSRYFYHPSLVLIALTVIYTGLFSIFLIPGWKHETNCDANSFCVQAFFRETFVGNFQKGDRAVVTLMSYPDTPLEGSVDSIGWGIAQQNGSTGFELWPSVKPTFEWIRLAQRIPVAVRIERVPGNIKLRAGTTASVVVITGTGTDGDQVPPIPRALH
jgi:multidrug resistance efflux pump